MVRNVAPIMRELESEDFYLLSGIEHGMRFSKWVDRTKLEKFSGLDRKNVGFRLDRCMRFDLIERRTIQYEGFRLRHEGYDALALRAFSERGTISSVGAPLGEGKESDVFEAIDTNPVALKFHREGITNFREVHRERDYTANHAHVSWLYTARKAAEREFDHLNALYPQISVPEPIDHNRHAIVMERIDGVELYRAKLPAEYVRDTLYILLDQVQQTYNSGLVHTDLSEYNVFLTQDSITIFDWPQAISTNHPNVLEFLERDIQNVWRFFSRKYPDQIELPTNFSRIAESVARNDDVWRSTLDK